VGVLSDENEIKEILDISEIFVLEKRLLDLTHCFKSNASLKRSCLELSGKIILNKNHKYNFVKLFTARGLI